jgi:translation initiation factor 5B
MTKQLYLSNTLEATVLEVKVTEGHGHTIDVILSNGILREGDRIVLCGLNGPIVTQIRALLTPQPMRELRVKSAYVHHKEIKAAMGVKIAAHDLEKAVAGSRLLRDGDLEELKKECMKDLTDMFSSVESKGVCVQASTLGSLEALLSFLKDSKIPVSGINVGPIYKKDVMRASIMVTTAKEFATILAFDVKVDKDAQELAEEMGVKIFTADIIYHLFDQFTAYMNNIKEERKKEKATLAIWPCILKIVPGCIFNKKDPIILGVDVVEGSVKIGTPICIPSKDCLLLGKVQGIENNHKPVQIAKKGQQVAIRIEDSDGTVMAGRQFGESDELCSKISRQSIDVLKELFRADVSRDEWLLIKKLKTMLHID